MKEVKVKAEVTKTMIEDLNNMRSSDFIPKLEDYLIKKAFRSRNRKKSINKIYSL